MALPGGRLRATATRRHAFACIKSETFCTASCPPRYTGEPLVLVPPCVPESWPTPCEMSCAANDDATIERFTASRSTDRIRRRHPRGRIRCNACKCKCRAGCVQGSRRSTSGAPAAAVRQEKLLVVNTGVKAMSTYSVQRPVGRSSSETARTCAVSRYPSAGRNGRRFRTFPGWRRAARIDSCARAGKPHPADRSARAGACIRVQAPLRLF